MHDMYENPRRHILIHEMKKSHLIVIQEHFFSYLSII